MAKSRAAKGKAKPALDLRKLRRRFPQQLSALKRVKKARVDFQKDLGRKKASVISLRRQLAQMPKDFDLEKPSEKTEARAKSLIEARIASLLGEQTRLQQQISTLRLHEREISTDIRKRMKQC